MLDLRERLSQALARNPGVRAVDLARACGVSTASVAQWRSGRTRSLKGDVARVAAELLGCDRDWLATGRGEPRWRTDESAGSAQDAGWPHLRFPLSLWLALDPGEQAIVEEAMLDAYDKLMERRETLRKAKRQRLKPAA
jgi:transcriptional regulator with XRE-family HTH domain